MNDNLCISITVNSFQLVKKYWSYNKFIYALKYSMIWVHWFSYNSQTLHDIKWKSFTPNFTQMSQEMWRVWVWGSYMPLSKIRLTMSCFLWNSSVFNNFLYTTSMPNFMKIWQTLQSFILGQRWTNRYGLLPCNFHFT